MEGAVCSGGGSYFHHLSKSTNGVRGKWGGRAAGQGGGAGRGRDR